MVPFLVLCMVTTISIAAAYVASIQSSELQYTTFKDYLMHSYLLNYGDFSSDDYNWLRTIIFFGASLLIPLILLNMLIAIMGDSYDRVKQNENTRDLREIAILVYEQELIGAQFSKRCRKRQLYNDQHLPWNYLCFVKPVYDYEETQLNKASEQWQGRIKSIKTKMQRIDKKNSHRLDELSEKFDELNAKFDQFSHKIDQRMNYLCKD